MTLTTTSQLSHPARTAASPARLDGLAVYGLVTLVYALTHGLFLSRLGFYRDDWYMLLAGVTRGPQGVVDLFQSDRPFMGVVYSWSFQLLGTDPLAWQVYAFLIRLVGILAFVWLVRQLWPMQSLATTAMGLLFAVYPGFLQQPNANTFSNHFITYSLSTLSIALTVAAFQARSTGLRLLYTGLALVTALGYFLIYEYMIGMEGLRLAVLWYLVGREERVAPARQALQTVKRWAPYLVVIVGYLIWRVFLFQSTRQATDLGGISAGYLADPLRMLMRLGFELVKDVRELLLDGWVVPLNGFLGSAKYRPLGVSFLLAALAVGTVALFYRFARVRQSGEMEPGAGSAAGFAAATGGLSQVAIGGWTVFATLLPMLLAGRDIHFDDGFDRYTLQSTAGAAILMVGIIHLAIRSPQARQLLVLVLVSLGVVTHYHNGLQWVDFWRFEREMWWQMTWRAPQLEPGTVLVARLPYAFLEDYEIWGPANLIYAPQPGDPVVHAEILLDFVIPKIFSGDVEERGSRTFGFERDFQKTLLLSWPSNVSCLHVLDGREPALPRDATPIVQLVARKSGVGQIRTAETGIIPPPGIFGPEPGQNWCFYYQKAELARQRGDWQAAASLGDESLALDLKANDRSEYLPFLEGYVVTGQMEKARQVASWIRADVPTRRSVCSMLTGIPADDTALSGDVRQTIDQILCQD
jgi:hypothetical protein